MVEGGVASLTPLARQPPANQLAQPVAPHVVGAIHEAGVHPARHPVHLSSGVVGRSARMPVIATAHVRHYVGAVEMAIRSRHFDLVQFDGTLEVECVM